MQQPENVLMGQFKRFSTIFLLKRFDLGHIMIRQKWFRELFRFREDIRSQSSKIACPRSQQIRGHANFSLDTDIFIF